MNVHSIMNINRNCNSKTGNCDKGRGFVRMKKSAANELSKECIYSALLQLMEQMPYSEITVTDIAKRAGVSRMTYYRNYSSKDDILLQCVDEMLCALEKNIAPSCIQWEEIWSSFFRSFRQSRLIAAVIKAGLKDDLFQCFSTHIHRTFQDKFLWDMTDYHNVLLVDYQIGALFGLLRSLLKNEYNVSDEQVAAFQVEVSSAIQKLAHPN